MGGIGDGLESVVAVVVVIAVASGNKPSHADFWVVDAQNLADSAFGDFGNREYS